MNEAQLESVGATDIAIVGMAARFPGAESVSEYWQNLQGGVESIRRLSDEQLLEAGVTSDALRDPSYVKAAGPLEDMAGFDAAFFGFSPKDAAILDPQHRHFYECAWSALEDTGHTAASLKHAIGVFAGCGPNLYFMHHVLPNRALQKSVGFFLLRHTGNDRDFLPTGVSYKLDLRGPSVAVQTACSTSLVAIHMACQSLLEGECDLALAGGVSIYLPHGEGYYFRENEILSPDGRCRPFDARAAGTVITNGCGVVALRRGEDAVADRDHIHALIRGSAINNDGANKVGFLAPSVEGHANAVCEALAMADLDAEEISYVETHGTGTSVGDPIEIAALTQAFRMSSARQQFCSIGSVKANIGHTDTAAGVAGLIKVVEALKHRQIPQSIHFENANPNIDFESSPFFVNTQLRPWKSDGRPRRAGVSSLGVGGTNAHAVLQEAPQQPTSDRAEPWQPLLLSAKTPAALGNMIANLGAHLAAHPQVNLADVSYTLEVGRERFTHRCALVAEDVADAAQALESHDRSRLKIGQSAEQQPSMVFMFPGGGTQYPNMGRRLYETEAVYRQAMDRCFALLDPEVEFDLERLMFPSAGQEAAAAEALREVGPSICAIFATEFATAQLLSSWDLKPDAMIGHSLGEYAAACLAGVMSLPDALRMVALRGRLLSATAGASMLSVPLPEAELQPLLGEDLDLAALNGPTLCLVSGENESLSRLERELAPRQVECRRLHLSAASHCRLLDPILDEFREGLETVDFSPPQVPYVSNVTGTWVRPADACQPEYWVRHLRNRVRFAAGMAEVLAEPHRVLLEVGPGRTLSSLARQQSKSAVRVVSTLRHPDESTDDVCHLRSAIGELWTAGVPIDWSHLRGQTPRARVPLPTYPFEHQRYWLEPVSTETTDSQSVRLQKSAAIEDWFYEPNWQESPLERNHEASEASAGVTLIFLDELGVGAQLAAQLRSGGQSVVTVRDGDSFYCFNDDEFALAAEEGLAGYQQLMTQLAAKNRLPTRILHLWLVTRERKFRAGSSFFHRNQERGLYSLVFLAQALGQQEFTHEVSIDVISTGIQSVGGEATVEAEKSTVLGPVRVIPTEMPAVITRSIDIDLPLEEADEQGVELAAVTAQRVWSEHCWGRRDRVVAWRGSRRFVESFTPRPCGDGPDRLRECGVYWITGGLGGIGLEIARHLASNYRARLVLLGRSELPARAAWDDWLARHVERDPTSAKIRAIRAMEQAGAEVLAVDADVANIMDIERALAATRTSFGSVDGVFHVAGVLDDGILQTRTAEAIDRVLTPKVHGTLLLADLLADEQLDFFALFSSTSALVGLPGQSDYTAANCFLDAFARSSQGRSLRAMAINWGVWKNVGMGQRAAARIDDGTHEEPRARQRTDHPLLDERLSSLPEETVFATRLSPQSHWILDEHRHQSGRCIVPGTGYLEFASAAFREATGNERIQISDLAIEAPLAVADNETRQLRTHLSSNGAGQHLAVESHSQGQWQVHATGIVTSLEDEQPPAIDHAQIASRCPLTAATDGQGLPRTRQMELLRFGPRWRVVRGASYGNGEAIAELSLPEAYVDDVRQYRLHPALLDLATGFALPLIEDYEGREELYVPVAYERVRVFRRLAPHMYSHVRLASGASDGETARFDVTIADECGNVLVEIDGFTMRRVPRGNSFGSLPPGGLADAARPTHSAAEELFLETYELGIEPPEGLTALGKLLASKSTPRQVVATSIPLDALRQRLAELDAADDETSVRFERPNLSSEYEPPRDELEEQLSTIWQELLGVEEVGVHDDFFELGGHSLIAVRLFAKIKSAWGVEFPISALFAAPTIAACGAMIRDELGDDVVASGQGAARPPRRPTFRHLVPMNQVDGRDQAPFFLVAGMFGNVLNLRHLAGHLGDDQPVYALQARGLHGDDAPHTRFEDMARDYLAEIRRIAPQGPYLLGGFSGGGITAFEMAQQLRAAGEQVGLLVMLDAFPPPAVVPQLTWPDRLAIQWQRLRQRGGRYLVEWAVRRFEWETRRWRRQPTEPQTPAEFRSHDIHIGFLEALDHYAPTTYSGSVHLFRPRLQPTYQLGGNRLASDERGILDARNHWSPFVEGEIHVHEVTGDHDAMVLEPHVRVLAAELRACLRTAQQRHRSE